MQHILRPPGYKRQFLSKAEEMVSIDVRGIRPEERERWQKEIAKNLYSLAKYSWRVGINLHADNIPEIKIDDYNPLYQKDWAAFYSDGTIRMRSTHWNSKDTLAHELFHYFQDLSGTLNWRNHAEQSYGEAGADFFSASYNARNYLGAVKIENVIKHMKTEINFISLQGQFRALEEIDGERFLANLLGDETPPSLCQAKYRNGDKFAFMAYVLNGFSTRKTINDFLKYERNDMISDLAQDRSRARALMALIRTCRDAKYG